MDAKSLSNRSIAFTVLLVSAILASSTLACSIPKNVFRSFLGHRDEDPGFMDDFGLESDDLVTEDNTESVLEGNESYGSADQGSSPSEGSIPDAVPDPVSKECGESGICVASYPVDIRGTANPPDVMAFANAGEYPSPAGISVTYTENAGPWYEWLVLKEPGDWAQASSPAGYSALGIQFWGDQTNGWASVILDGVEVWRGDITAYGTDGVNYFVYVELTGEVGGPHTLRTEVLGQNGAGGGDNVPVFYFAYRK